ncbi:MAG TPA: hypothetical protein VNZ52_15125, partial [Candidatus Thermoplasmatota archaeon]|nr:hypothetical protein [Candidatus Thermoplasmatota archaeon]
LPEAPGAPDLDAPPIPSPEVPALPDPEAPSVLIPGYRSLRGQSAAAEDPFAQPNPSCRAPVPCVYVLGYNGTVRHAGHRLLSLAAGTEAGWPLYVWHTTADKSGIVFSTLAAFVDHDREIHVPLLA